MKKNFAFFGGECEVRYYINRALRFSDKITHAQS